jgi:hypothetical protein
MRIDELRLLPDIRLDPAKLWYRAAMIITNIPLVHLMSERIARRANEDETK